MQRRTFLERSAGVALARAVPVVREPRPSLLQFHQGSVLGRTPDTLTTLRDPRVKALALAALDAAKSAGAGYADVRVTYTTQRSVRNSRPVSPAITLGISVRALVNGYWGWAATPYLSTEEAPRIGREAVLLAKGNAEKGPPRQIEWAPIPVVRDGTWSTPIRIDPFAMAIEEICDWTAGESAFIHDLMHFRGDAGAGNRTIDIEFDKQERVFASTEGSYLTQTVYVTSGSVDFTYRGRGGGVEFSPAQGGLEYILDSNIREQVREELDRIDHAPPPLPLKQTLDVGRYDIVFTAPTMATLVAETLAPATQVDRALGYEANANGTSYLGPDPFAYLGTTIASPFVTLTADRSQPKGLATIQWDDDGVVPEDFTLVKNGVLVDYQSTREQAAWLAPWYQKQRKPIRSHGCAASEDALSYTMQHTPNLTLQPGSVALGLDDIVASLDHGLVVDGMNVHMDFQCLTGFSLIGGQDFLIFEVRHGKRVAQYDSGVHRGLLFRSPELWKNVLALGGPASRVVNISSYDQKGEPANTTKYSVAAVPALIKQVAVIDPAKKA